MHFSLANKRSLSKIGSDERAKVPFQFSLSVACFHCLLEPLSSETMCLECFVFPSGLLYQFLIGWNFFHFAYAERTQWNVETYGYIVVPRTNQVRVRAGISWKFRDIQFEELPPCNVHFSKTVPGVLDKY